MQLLLLRFYCYLRGPKFKHVENAHQWARFWEAVGDRDIRAIKVSSHVSAQDAVSRGLNIQLWFANHLADGLAEEGARVAQLPPENVFQVQESDKLALRVQTHLLAVASSVARAAKSIYGPSSKADRLAESRGRKVAREAALQEAQETSMHRLAPGSARCLDCLLGPTKDLTRAAFLATPCPKRPHQLHSSHRLARHRGLWWCEVCGGTGSTQFQKLSGVCTAPSKYGLSVITRVRAGKLPRHLKAWPDEVEGEPDLELVHPGA